MELIYVCTALEMVRGGYVVAEEFLEVPAINAC